MVPSLKSLFSRSPFSSSGRLQAEGKKLYDFAVTGIDGKPLNMDQFRDKVVVVVNVATKCGFTGSNYPQLSELLNKYYDQGLRVLLFPCNQFGNQESGTAESICSFAGGYNPKFIMAEKVDVNGSATHPLWAWMKDAAHGFMTNGVKWNFTKFIIGKDGLVDKHRFAPTDEPIKMEDKIKEHLSA